MIDQDPPQDPVRSWYQCRDRAAVLTKGCGVPRLEPRLAEWSAVCAAAWLFAEPSPSCKLPLLLGFPAKLHKDIYQSRFLRFH